MSKEQIEKMAKAMCGNGMSNGNCAIDDEPCYLECVYGSCAERLYCKGYRKQSELTPCDVCQYNPPSSGDGKPCSICPAQAKVEGGTE